MSNKGGQVRRSRQEASGRDSLRLGEFGRVQSGKFGVLLVNSRLDDPKEVSRLIKNPWIREFSECGNWQEGGEKLNKFNRLTVGLSPESVSRSGMELREQIVGDLLMMAREMLIRIREETFRKITPDKDTVWLRTMAQDAKATLKDRTESCSILIQQSPMLYLTEMRTLQGIFTHASNKTGFLKMIDTVSNLMMEDSVFPKSKELSLLQNHPSLQPLLNNREEVTITIFEFLQIYFEHFLKEWFASFTNVLLRMLDDSLWTIRKKIITVIYHLTSSIMEQRYLLVNSIVHKFGDREDKVASHATFLLGELLKHHGENSETLSMILNVLSDHISRNLDSFHKLLSSNPKASSSGHHQVVFRQVYRLILFISEIKLSRNYNYFSLEVGQSSNSIANYPPPIKILRLCLSSLKVIVESKNWNQPSQTTIIKEPLYRLLRVTLNCISRSLPYAEAQIKMINNKSSNQLLEEFEANYIPKLYYLCHNINCASIRIVILGVLFRISNILGTLSDRYYRLLYSQLLYKPIYTPKNKKLLVFLIWQIINDPNTNYKVSLSILKRSIQISLHSNDISMLTCFLVILVNVINFKHFRSNSKVKDTQSSNLETNNLKLLSGTVSEIIIKTDEKIQNEDDEENFVDVEAETDQDEPNPHLQSINASRLDSRGQIVNYMQGGGRARQDSRSYDFFKRDPRYANCENIHFWEMELLKSHYHPLIVELVYKSILICHDEKDGGTRDLNGVTLSVIRFLENFKLGDQINRRDAEGSPILRIFELCSLKLFMQILSYNPVDLGLVLLKSIDTRRRDNVSREMRDSKPATGFKRITTFNKWNNKHIPSYLDFYRLYFNDPMVKAMESYNLGRKSDDHLGNGIDDEEFDNFEIDYDETSGKMIQSGKKHNKYIQDDLMVDSLIDDFSDKRYQQGDTDDDDYPDENDEIDPDLSGTDDDIDLLDGVNMDDFDDDFDFEQDDEEEEEEEEEIKGKSKRSLDKKSGGGKAALKKFKSDNKKGMLNTITYVDADEMEEFLD
ncbi:CCAAT-box transcription factor-like protein [Cryptosporidium canis]|nr:CCAAT-box transcription factor-like protein [Cryptosporidium canis]